MDGDRMQPVPAAPGAQQNPLDTIEEKALATAVWSQDQDVIAKTLDIAKSVSEKRKLIMEAKKIDLEAEGAAFEHKHARAKYWATVLLPTIATAIAISFQAWQFSSSSKQQTSANEDSQWRGAIGSVSLESSNKALVGAFVMDGFFDSSHHSMQARNVAAALLPQLDNTDAFDKVLFDMIDYPDTPQSHILGIARAIFVSELDLYKVNVSKKHPLKLDFKTVKQILSEYDQPDFIQRDDAKRKRAFAAGWELASVSDALQELWTRQTPNKRVTPREQNLEQVVLAFDDFQGLDFSKAILIGGAFYKTQFKDVSFVGANLRRRLFSGVALDGADLCGITDFDESKWEDTNWWQAKHISKELLDYLEKNDPVAFSNHKDAARKISCG